MELQPRRKVVVSQTVPLPRNTVPALISTIETLFTAKDRPTRMLYQKGEDLLVEIPKLIDEDPDARESGLLTPYQVVRQHCEVDIFDADQDDALRTFCAMITQLRKTCPIVSGVVVSSEQLLARWLTGINVEAVFGVTVYVDPDAPKNVVFLCGSTRSALIRDFENTVAIQRVGG